jgi:hypothetical protein
MSTQASTLTIGSDGVRWRPSGFPLATALLSVAVCVIAPNGSYATVALALLWFPYLVTHPQAGLWFAPVLVMAASLLASPTGFIGGWGYSPQLAFWAVATCIAFVATSLAVFRWRSVLFSRDREGVRPPLALYAFFGVSVVGAALGLAHGYSVSDVGKQFFGCLLFVAYFWFALMLTPSVRDIKRVVRIVTVAAVVSGLFYVFLYVPIVILVRDTILNDLAASVACLLLPQLLSASPQTKRKAAVMSVALLLVPLVDTFKRSVAGFAICVLLLYGLRSGSRKKRLFWLLGSFTLFGLMLATPMLNYVGRAVAKEPIISNLIPPNVQNNYSVFLRVFETAQDLASSGGPSLLGTGLGSTFRWYDPYTKKWFTQQTLAMGWAYVLVKLGILGLLAFVWLIGDLLVRAIKSVPSGGHLALVFFVGFFAVEMVGSTVILYFATAPWVGMGFGWLHVLNKRRELAAKAQNGIPAPGGQGAQRVPRPKPSPHRGPAPQGAM